MDDEQLNEEMNFARAEAASVLDELRDLALIPDAAMLEAIYYLWILWADFHIFINDTQIPFQIPPEIIRPAEVDRAGAVEHVYPILDYGNQLSTSVGEDLAKGTRYTGKYLNTVDKMVKIALGRAKGEGGVKEGEEIHFAFGGHEIGQRKGFLVCIESHENVIVTNFEPGEWGDRTLRTMKTLAEKGFLPGVKRP